MNKDYSFKKEIKILKDGVWLSPPNIPSEKVSGCEALKFVKNKIETTNVEIDGLERKINELKQEVVKNTELMYELSHLGYCDISQPVYKRIEGILIKDENGDHIIEKYIHNENCKHKGE